MYVNVNVQSIDKSHNQVLLTQPTTLQWDDHPPQQHAAHTLEDTTRGPPGLSYVEEKLDPNHFDEKNPDEMVEIIHSTVEKADAVVIWGQIYVDKDRHDGHMIAGIHDVHANFDEHSIPQPIRLERDGGIKVYYANGDGTDSEEWLYMMFRKQKQELLDGKIHS